MSVEPYDDFEIDDDDPIIRRVDPDQHLVRDENSGEMRISSKLFSPSSGPLGGMSVDLLRLIEEAGLHAQDFVTTPVFRGSISFSAGSVREAGLRVGRNPLVGIAGVPDNPFHGEVWGPPARPNRFTNTQKRAILEAAEWFVELQGVKLKV